MVTSVAAEISSGILKPRLMFGISRPMSILPSDSSLRLFLDRFVFHRIAVWLLSTGSSPLELNHATRVKIIRCKESLWKLLYYAGCEIFQLEFVYQELKYSLRIYYMCQCGFYVYSVAAWETRRKDFAVMMSHHIITFILIGSSYLVG